MKKMHPHPLIVHFPIALFTCGVLLELVGLLGIWRPGKDHAVPILWLAALTGVAAMISGVDYEELARGRPGVGPWLDAHRAWGVAATAGMVLAAFTRVGLAVTKRFAGAAATLCVLAELGALAAVLTAGHLGATMVHVLGG